MYRKYNDIFKRPELLALHGFTRDKIWEIYSNFQYSRQTINEICF